MVGSMRLFLIRHAAAVAKHNWARSDQQRPLTETGEHQATAIAHWFNQPPTVIVCSPTVRCIASVLPLAQRFELDLLTRAELLPNNPAPPLNSFEACSIAASTPSYAPTAK